MHAADIGYVCSFKCAESNTQYMKEFITMKIVIATLTFAALLTSPALAQYQNGAWRSPYYRAYAQQFGPYADYSRFNGVRRSPYNVYDTSGHYVGSDPDPRVRSMLARDPPGRD
jgi:hypothetical protein